MTKPKHRTNIRSRGAGTVLLSALATLCTGCPQNTEQIEPLAPLPLSRAIELVNRNNRGLQTTLRAKAGHARGRVTERGGNVRKFDVDAALLVRPPRCLRLDLSTFGDSQLILGSNPARYWLVQPGNDTLVWGRHDQPQDYSGEQLSVRPDLVLDALGIALLPVDTTGAGGPLQRITGAHQQLLFVEYNNDGQGLITKEYWLSRFEPRLIERVIFRDAAGVVMLDARLSEHKPVAADGPLAPHRIEALWPKTGDRLTFTARGWAVMPQVTEAHPGFAFPLDRGETFSKVVDWDAERGVDPVGISMPLDLPDAVGTNGTPDNG